MVDCKKESIKIIHFVSKAFLTHFKDKKPFNVAVELTKCSIYVLYRPRDFKRSLNT